MRDDRQGVDLSRGVVHDKNKRATRTYQRGQLYDKNIVETTLQSGTDELRRQPFSLWRWSLQKLVERIWYQARRTISARGIGRRGVRASHVVHRRGH
jgi:hypothetical protein